jgi:cell division transport system permease protein
MEKFRYFIKEGFKNIKVNRIMTLASLSILTMCLVMLGTSILVSLNITSLVAQIQDQNQIIIYLKDNLSQENILKIGNEIKADTNVKNSVFVSKAEALEAQKKMLGESAHLLDYFDNDKDNPLPDSYKVTLKDMSKYETTLESLRKIDGIDNVSQHISVAKKLTNIRNAVRMVGFWLFLILALVSLFIISNTVKIAMFVRRREINIMKFVGATDWFIRWPFMVEGAIIGLSSALIAMFAEWLIYTKGIVRLVNALGVTAPVSFDAIMPYFTAGFIVSGVLVGVLGSIVSARKYLRV